MITNQIRGHSDRLRIKISILGFLFAVTHRVTVPPLASREASFFSNRSPIATCRVTLGCLYRINSARSAWLRWKM